MSNSWLSVLGTGQVCPGGLTVDDLKNHTAWQHQADKSSRPQSTPISTFRIDLKQPALLHWQQQPRLRRVSAVTLFLVEAATQAMRALPADISPSRVGLIVCAFAGPVAYSRRFYQQIIENGPRMASPALFPETVYNSPTSHVASILGLDGAAYTFSGDETALSSALETASVWLEAERCDAVLVAAGEELDPASLEAFRVAGWLRAQTQFTPCEGAAALLLTRPSHAQGKAAPALRLAAPARPSFSRKEAVRLLTEQLQNLTSSSEKPRLDLSSRNAWLPDLRALASAGYDTAAELSIPGYAFAASTLWQLSLRLAESQAETASRSLFIPLLGSNHQVSVLEFRPPAVTSSHG